MVEIKRVWNPKVKAWVAETLPYEAQPLYAKRVTAAGGADESFSPYLAPTGSVSLITAVKMMSESADAWWSFGGDLTDLHFMPSKGTDAIAGTPSDPYIVLDEGESIVPVARNAAGDTDYGVVIYGAERGKEPTP